MRNIKPVSREQLEACLKDLSRSKQKCSVIEYIFNHPHALTHKIAAGGGAINVPNIAKIVRPICKRHGIYIINYLPHSIHQHINRYGSKTPVHRWFLLSIETNHAA